MRAIAIANDFGGPRYIADHATRQSKSQSSSAPSPSACPLHGCSPLRSEGSCASSAGGCGSRGCVRAAVVTKPARRLCPLKPAAMAFAAAFEFPFLRALLSLTAAVGAECSGQGVRICSIAVGPAEAGIHQRMHGTRSNYKKLLPNGHPERMARLAWRSYRLGRRVVVPGAITRCSRGSIGAQFSH